MTNLRALTPPYYAVIFSSQRKPADGEEYAKTAEYMETLAKTMPGYLGIESARGESGLGLTISYWDSEEAIANWKKQVDHQEAQRRGRTEWYENYDVRVARVERAYSMKKQGRRKRT